MLACKNVMFGEFCAKMPCPHKPNKRLFLNRARFLGLVVREREAVASWWPRSSFLPHILQNLYFLVGLPYMYSVGTGSLNMFHLMSLWPWCASREPPAVLNRSNPQACAKNPRTQEWSDVWIGLVSTMRMFGREHFSHASPSSL